MVCYQSLVNAPGCQSSQLLMVSAPSLIIVDLDNAHYRALILEMTREYFYWISGEIHSTIGLDWRRRCETAKAWVTSSRTCRI
jgi:hypothetical protein